MNRAHFRRLTRWVPAMAVAVGLSFFVAGCATQQPTAAIADDPQRDAPIQSATITMWVQGLGCPQCATNVDKQLKRIPGVEKVKVDLGDGRVVVHRNTSQPLTRAELAQAIRDSGFTLVRMETP